MIYIIVFAISLFFVYLSNRLDKVGQYLCLFLSVFFPVFLAAVRSPEIGTDTLNYLYLFREAASGGISYSDYVLEHFQYEVGYTTFLFLCGSVFHDDTIFFFISHCIIIIPILYTILKWSNGKGVVFGMFVFYCLFYNESLNLMRQYMSMSMALLSVYYVFSNKKLKAAFFLILSVSFHYTAVLVLLIYVVYILVRKFPIKKNWPIYLIGGICFFVVLINFQHYLDLVFPSFIDSDKYTGSFNKKAGGISSTSTAIVYLSICFVLFIKSFNNKSYVVDFFFVISIMAFFFNFLSIYSSTMYRLSLFFSVFSCISLPLCFEKGKQNKMAFWSYYIKGLLPVYWVFAVIIHESNETYPYISTLFPFLSI